MIFLRKILRIGSHLRPIRPKAKEFLQENSGHEAENKVDTCLQNSGRDLLIKPRSIALDNFKAAPSVASPLCAASFHILIPLVTSQQITFYMNAILIALSQVMVEAYSWGHAAKQADAPFRSIDEVNAAPGLPELAGMKAGLAELFGPAGQDTAIFEKADALVDQYPAFDDLREYLIDLCVLLLLGELEAEEEEDGDALDSPEWLKIEEAAADRGTELLNVLIYIKDLKINNADPDLEDFLYEFLLADEEDFQDELAIYEPFVKNLDLITAPLKHMVLAGNNQRDNELRELFTPMMLFFREEEREPGKLTLSLLENSALPELHAALYRLLCAAMAADL